LQETRGKIEGRDASSKLIRKSIINKKLCVSNDDEVVGSLKMQTKCWEFKLNYFDHWVFHQLILHIVHNDDFIVIFITNTAYFLCLLV